MYKTDRAPSRVCEILLIDWLFNGLFRVTKKTLNLVSLSLCVRIRQSPKDSPYKMPVVRKAFSCHDIIMKKTYESIWDILSISIVLFVINQDGVGQWHAAHKETRRYMCCYTDNIQSVSKRLGTLRPRLIFRRRHFEVHLLEWKYMNFD